ncbi:MAG TPA: PAS domain-containing protein [Sedimentisphaerales bacterium]|nr:PAS domain-containing protein [Sedimentisphaerales bacterium]HRS12343.1 PAS domain-containing protein [Sedimentisphaerales bacterium]HRV48883.1 PAS domain-containing protein [Sedimentisphaerales bacterium]
MVPDERWDSLLQCTCDRVVVVDGNGVISYVNHVSPVLSGGRESVVGRCIYDFLSADHREKVRELIAGVLQTGERISQVVCFSANGDGALSCEARIGPITQNGRTVAVGMFFTDITERERLQARLRERDRLLRSIVRAVPRMMDILEGLIRHGRDAGEPARRARELDLCRAQMIQIGRLASIGKVSCSLMQSLPQFLTAIGMSVESALARLDGMPSREDAGRDLDAALRAIGALATRVEEFRSFAETGSRNRLVHAVDLAASLTRVVRLLEARARAANTVIRIGNRDEWPPVRMAEGDAEQLFYALIEYLMRFADGKRHHCITVGYEVKDHCVELHFSCDNHLVEKEDSSIASDRSFQAEPAPQAVDLGLHVAWDIVVRAGGTIRRESIPGRGSTFFVCLPILDHASVQRGQNGGKRKTTCFCRR